MAERLGQPWETLSLASAVAGTSTADPPHGDNANVIAAGDDAAPHYGHLGQAHPA